MIYGIGTDIIRIDRVAEVYRRFEARFPQRLLMQTELRDFQRTNNPERFLAMRFAAKEALVKAMGTGFRHGMWIRDVGVRHNRWGRPEPLFSERGQQRCAELGIGRAYLTLSDEAGLVTAMAVMECR